MSYLTGIAVWWWWALLLPFPRGWLPALILLSLLALWRPAERVVALKASACWPALVVMLFGLVWMAMGAWHGDAGPAWALTWPCLLALPVSLALSSPRPSMAWLWSGVAVGGVASGAWGSIQRLQGEARAEGLGSLDAILFGNLALLLGLCCFAGLGWALSQRRRRGWGVLLLAGGVGGLLASLLSGTRGGWVTLPLLLPVFYAGYGHRATARQLVGGLGLVLILGMGAYAVPQTGIQDRLQLGMGHVSRYLDGERGVEVAARVMIWQTSLELIAARPLTGWGEEGAWQERSRRYPSLTRYHHAHNDLLEAWVTRGLPGVLVLIALYLLPLRLFWPGLRAGDPARKSLSVCGVLLPVAFFGFGLSYSFMAYPVGIAAYCGWLLVLWAYWQGNETKASQGLSPLARRPTGR
ncbi:hypothetical protein BEI_2146 [Halomonas beimenensis]|uniref:O-antigen ligase-related domain-containing protein n=1 Tax=Halomonas beimenensis TaxID=475662 RepID=A0A291P887_9GAMM|nr:hypothetical protein BEI_2146 [Halomonas beimenensis]